MTIFRQKTKFRNRKSALPVKKESALFTYSNAPNANLILIVRHQTVNLSVFAENNDAVIAINSTSSYPDDLLNICWEAILAGMLDEGALPGNSAVSSALCQELKHLSLPVD